MIAPSVLPGRAYQRIDRVSRCLVHWRAADLSLTPLTGQPATFTRTTLAGSSQDTRGFLRRSVHSQPRFGYLDEDGDGVYESPHLLLESGRTQLVENADLEADAVGWVAAASTIARDATGTRAPSGLASLKVTTTNATGSGVFVRKRDGTRMTAAATTMYTGSVWIYLPAGHPAIGKTIRLQYDWYNVTPALISSSQGTPVALVAGINRLQFTATSPAATVTVDLLVATDSAEGVFDFWVDCPQFEAGESASSATPTNSDVGGLVRAAVGQELTIYQECSPVWPRTGTVATAHGVFVLGGIGAAAADGKTTVQIYREVATATLAAQLEVNGSVAAASSLSIPTTGRLKLLAQLRASGESHVLHFELNGVAATDSATRLVAGTSWRTSEFRPAARTNDPALRQLMLHSFKIAAGRFTADQMAQLF